MRILVKIAFSFAVLIIGLIAQAIISETGNNLRIIPGVIIIFGLIGVWRYKPKKTNKTDLDKTL